MPARGSFMGRLLAATFPDMEEMGLKRTGYGYSRACRKTAIDLGLLSRSGLEDIAVGKEGELFGLMLALSRARMNIFQEKGHAELLTSGAYLQYQHTLGTFCDDQNGTLKNWLGGPDKPVRISYEAALFFTYLMTRREACLRADEQGMSWVQAFASYCLSCLGVSGIEEPVAYELSDFAWRCSTRSGGLDDPVDQALLGTEAFCNLSSKSVILLAAALMTVLELLGKDEDKVAGATERFHRFMANLMQEEIDVASGVDEAERSLMDCIRTFEPRSIQVPIGEAWSPLDFYVEPDFCQGDASVSGPLESIGEDSRPRRRLLVAKTGTGKTMYLQTAALKLLKERYEVLDSGEDVDDGGKLLLISIPAKMFTYCFRSGARYRSWTADFIDLFFNCMWKLYPAENFFSKRSNLDFRPAALDAWGEFKLTEALKRYIKRKAEAGELVALFDSFDEVSSGAERSAYAKALAAFCETHCIYPVQDGKSGALVVVSSREMSPSTMVQLRDSLKLDAHTEAFGICQLTEAQQAELIMKWKSRVESHDALESSRYLISKIRTNHFLQEYAVNPYMLSVICYDSSLDLSRITQTYIASLVQRMAENNSRQDWAIQSVLRRMEKVLQELAVETIVQGTPHFSASMLDAHLRTKMDTAELADGQVNSFIERLHEIFVTEVGLIVPADGDDESFQFINSPIRFELAARGLQRTFEDSEKVDLYRYTILPYLESVPDYVGLIVPLLCDIKKEDVRLAELLSFDLAFREFKTEQDEKLLLRAMLDLVLARYSLSVLNLADPGTQAKNYVLKAQRVLVLRLLSSPRFSPTAEEARSLLQAPAYKNSEAWLTPQMKDAILERASDIP